MVVAESVHGEDLIGDWVEDDEDLAGVGELDHAAVCVVCVRR